MKIDFERAERHLKMAYGRAVLTKPRMLVDSMAKVCTSLQKGETAAAKAWLDEFDDVARSLRHGVPKGQLPRPFNRLHLRRLYRDVRRAAGCNAGLLAA